MFALERGLFGAVGDGVALAHRPVEAECTQGGANGGGGRGRADELVIRAAEKERNTKKEQARTRG